ncbi:MAG: 2-oxoacid:acceptor oxidoreductase [Eubacteriales bacterium]|nr:2-oxoacid:acceptor oxidoreductase [Eubacteriales bacterium]
MRFNVTFRSEECKGCELCIQWCKKGLIALDTSYLNKGGIHPAMITNKDECVGCCNCALMCPDAIITIERIED